MSTNPWQYRRPQGSSAGVVLQLIRTGEAVTRGELAEASGFARSTIANRLTVLNEAGLLRSDGEGPSTGGRPPRKLAFNDLAGVVLAADLGATHARLAVTDLAGRPLAATTADIDVADGPDAVLGWVNTTFTSLLAQASRDASEVWGIGIGVPGPVEFAAGRAVNPPIMPGWDGVAIPSHFADYEVPVLVDNDVNIMTVGEYRSAFSREVDDMVMVKVGTGIGCGIIADGHIQRGAQGAAGDLGHVHLNGREEMCRCGNRGCLEAVAGGAGLARQLREEGRTSVHSIREVLDLISTGDPLAMRLVRDAGRMLGETLATAVNLLNPSVLVLSGQLVQANDQLIAGVREVVYQRSLPLATRHLRILRSTLGADAGVVGAAIMTVDRVLQPSSVDDYLESLSLVG